MERSLNQRFRCQHRRDARRLDQLPLARRGDVEIHCRHQRRIQCPVEPGLGRRGPLIILGQDYGEGSSIIQERTTPSR